MSFTDPPYNVDLGNHGGQGRGARRRRIANDALDPLAWEGFVRAWARNLLTSVDGAIYCCMSSKELPLVSRVLAEEGGHWSDTLIWRRTASSWGGPTTSGHMSRSGMAGERMRPITGVATAIRTTSGTSIDLLTRRSIRR